MSEKFAEVLDAIDGVRRLSWDFWMDVGPHFTCQEANALMNLLESCGLEEHANALLEGHAVGDDPGDDHWDTHLAVCTDPRCTRGDHESEGL